MAWVCLPSSGPVFVQAVKYVLAMLPYLTIPVCVCILSVCREQLNPLELQLSTWIDSILFTDSVIIIRKRHTPKTQRFRRVMAGTVVAPSLLSAGEGARQRLQLYTELGFYKNMAAVGIDPDLSEVDLDGRYSSEGHAFRPEGAVRSESNGEGDASVDVLSVQVFMEFPTPMAPFYFTADAPLAGNETLLVATKLHCVREREVGYSWNCPWLLLSVVEHACESYSHGVFMPGGRYIYSSQ